MQASIVSALMPITTTVPVTLIVLHRQDSHSLDAKKVPMPFLTPKPTTTQPASQTTPRSVTVKTKSLLRCTKNIPNHRKSLLKSVSTSQDKKSLVKLTNTEPPDKTPIKQVIYSKATKSLLKPELTNLVPVTAKSSQRPTLRSVPEMTECTKDRASSKAIMRQRSRRPKKVLSIIPGPDSTPTKSSAMPTLRSVTVKANQAPVIKSKSSVSLLKPVIVSQDKNSENMREETTRDQLQIINISNNGMIDNLQQSQRSFVRPKRPAKSLLKPDLSVNLQISSSKATLGDHDYVLNQGQIFPDDRRTSLPKKIVSDITDDFKRLQRTKRSLYVLKKTLEISKKKLHSRQRRMSASIGEVTELKKLLLNLKSRNLVTDKGHVQLEAAVDRATKVLKNNFATDPTA